MVASLVASPRVALPATERLPFTSRIPASISISPPAAFRTKFPVLVSIVLAVVCAI